MTTFKITLITYIFLILTSCYSNKQFAGKESLPEIHGNISANQYDDSADKTIIYAGKDNLYFIHHKSSPLLSRFKLTNDSLLNQTRFINIGNGPEEMQSLMFYSISPDGDKIIFNDPNLHKSLKFFLNNDSISVQQNNLGLLDKKSITLLHFAIGNPNGTLATYFSHRDSGIEGIVGYISTADSVFLPLKGVGKDEMNNLSFHQQLLYSPNSQVFTQPDGDKCLFVSNIGQYAEIFNIESDKAINKKILVDIVPSFTLDERGRIIDADDELKFGFKVSVTPDRIYLAPYRMTYAERKDGLMNNPKYEAPAHGAEFVDEIWVYNWDGELLKKTGLNPCVSSFQVNTDNILWATSEDDNYEPIVVNYDLGSILQ